MMTTKHEIEVPGLPEGWKPVAYRRVSYGDTYLVSSGEIHRYWGETETLAAFMVIEKIKPRRIVFEETNEYFKLGQSGHYFHEQSRTFGFTSSALAVHLGYKIWREVKEGE